MRVNVHKSITELGPERWRALEGTTGLLEYGYLAALELSGSLAHNAFETALLGLWEGDRLLAVLPAYLKRDEVRDLLPDWAAQVARKNGLDYDPTLYVGVPFARVAGRKLLVAAGVERAPAMRRLVAAAQELIATSPSPVIHHYLSTPDEVELLVALGFHRRISARHQWRNRGYASFDDFVSRLVRGDRKSIRQERKAFAEAGYRASTVNGADITDEQIDVMWRFHEHTVAKYGRTGDRYTREYFTCVRELLADRLVLVLIEDGDRPIGASLNIVADRIWYGRQWGAGTETKHLMFHNLYAVIEAAIARGVDAIDLGGTMEYQLVRGFVPVGYDHSATWVGDEALDDAFRVLAARERAWTPGDVGKKLARSPYPWDRDGGPTEHAWVKDPTVTDGA